MNWKQSTIVILIMLVAQIGYAQGGTDYEKKMQALKAEAASKGTKLLPDITCDFDMATGVKLTWFNHYDIIESIAIQKSSDSLTNFATIGYLKKNKRGLGVFTDESVTLGRSFYRLLIVFNSDLNWYSNRVGITLDSAKVIQYYETKGASNLQQALTGQNSKSGNLNNTNGEVAPPLAPNFTDPLLPNFTFQPSQNVYYDLFDKQIHINLNSEVATVDVYSLEIWNPYTKTMVKKIRKLPKPKLVIDSHNIQEIGLYQFKVYKNGKEVDKGFFEMQ